MIGAQTVEDEIPSLTLRQFGLAVGSNLRPNVSRTAPLLVAIELDFSGRSFKVLASEQEVLKESSGPRRWNRLSKGTGAKYSADVRTTCEHIYRELDLQDGGR